MRYRQTLMEIQSLPSAARQAETAAPKPRLNFAVQSF
jgi:hypothetical protein